MSCNSCTTNKKSCGTGGCGTKSCGGGKLNVFDWLANVQLPGGMERFDCVEVRFKNSRKEYFKNTDNIPLQIGDVVATETSIGHDVGVVTLTGELVRLQMKKRRINWEDEGLPKIYRKANQKDIDIWQEARNKEVSVQKQSRELAIALGLEMKISDVEFQGDGSKATFYYTAEGRVDFRQLIKDLAKAFSVRIEMRQIGFRQEAARLGGIGSCGRELCCSTWLTDFRTVTTSAARYQQLSLNPQKLAGQCGKLKCCLNFELDTYMDALQDFPKMETKLFTEKGKASCQKIDIFKRLMWFTYDEMPSNWYKMSVESVKEIIKSNQNNKKVTSLDDYAIITSSSVGETSYEEEIKQIETQEDSITRFDKPNDKKNKKNNQKNNQKAKSEANNQQNNDNSAPKNNNSNKNKPKKQQNNPNNQQQSIKKEQKPQKNLKEDNKNHSAEVKEQPIHITPIPNEPHNQKDLSNNNPKKLKENKNKNFRKKPNHNRNSTTKEK